MNFIATFETASYMWSSIFLSSTSLNSTFVTFQGLLKLNAAVNKSTVSIATLYHIYPLFPAKGLFPKLGDEKCRQHKRF